MNGSELLTRVEEKYSDYPQLIDECSRIHSEEPELAPELVVSRAILSLEQDNSQALAEMNATALGVVDEDR